MEVVSDPDAIARILHGARAPPALPPPGQILLLPWSAAETRRRSPRRFAVDVFLERGGDVELVILEVQENPHIGGESP